MDIKFRELIDKIPSSFIEREKYCDYMNLCKVHNIPKEYIHSRSKVEEYLRKRIPEVLFSNEPNAISTKMFIRLPNQILLQFFVYETELNPYFRLSKIIIKEIKGLKSIAAFDEENKWEQAIKLAKDILLLSGDYSNQLDELDFSKRLYAIATSAKVLNKYGYNFEIENGQIIFDQSELSKIANDIETDIKSLGGINVAQRIFQLIKPKFNQKQQRYHLISYYPSPDKQGTPDIPIGYILNLCVKHFHDPKISAGCPKSTFNRILEISRAFASAAYDVQAYSPFEKLFHNPETVIELLREVAVHDSLFSLVQLRPSDVSKILRKLFGWIPIDQQISALGCEIEKIIKVAEKILEIAGLNNGPTIIKREQLVLDFGYNCIIDQILKILSHTETCPNQGFKLPTDISENNFLFKPLLRINREEYILMNSSWCSPAFYEAIVSELRDKINNFNIGKLIEDFIRSELNLRGITYSYGDYGKKKGRQDGECDVIIETSDTIFFIESKGKALTRVARSGSDISILIDLTQSVIDAQLQAGNHETTIRKEGYLELDQITKIDLNKRNIERIAITLLDFGGFQDRTVINDLLKIMSIHEYTGNATYKNELEKLNKKAKKIHEQFEELRNLNAVNERNPFFNCWFLSLPQFLIILDDSTSNETFKQALFKIRHLTYKYLDFYFEYFQATNLREKNDENTQQ